MKSLENKVRTTEDAGSIFLNRIKYDPLLSPKQAAQYLNVKPKFIYERIATGEIAAHQVGRLRRIRLSTLETWLASQQKGNHV